MVDIRHLKCLAQCACGFESRPGHNIKNETPKGVHFLVVHREQVNCFTCVGTRKSGVCFGSNQNDEEREARNFCDDKNLLVEEIPALGTCM